MYINRVLSSQGASTTAGIPPMPWSLEPKKLFSNHNPVTFQVVYREYWKIENPLADTEPERDAASRDAVHLFARRLKNLYFRSFVEKETY